MQHQVQYKYIWECIHNRYVLVSMCVCLLQPRWRLDTITVYKLLQTIVQYSYSTINPHIARNTSMPTNAYHLATKAHSNICVNIIHVHALRQTNEQLARGAHEKLVTEISGKLRGLGATHTFYSPIAFLYCNGP